MKLKNKYIVLKKPVKIPPFRTVKGKLIDDLVLKPDIRYPVRIIFPTLQKKFNGIRMFIYDKKSDVTVWATVKLNNIKDTNINPDLFRFALTFDLLYNILMKKGDKFDEMSEKVKAVIREIICNE